MWVVIEIGCLECQKPSELIAVCETGREAERVIEACMRRKMDRNGLFDFQAFEVPDMGYRRPLPAPPAGETA